MSHIILQPAGDPQANEHYVGTVENPVDLKRIKPLISEEVFVELKKTFSDKVPVWGVASGKKQVNVGKWGKIQPGDIALFARDNKIFASAVVVLKIHQKDLALDLWKTDKQGNTWEYVYFLDEVTNQDINYRIFNKIVDYKEKNIIRGFNVLDDKKSEAVIDYFGLRSEIHLPVVRPEEYYEDIKFDADKVLDKEGSSIIRTEQAFLRRYLFKGNKFSQCGICARKFPVNFLVAAHIKKRSICSDEEKKDYKNIVMAMCKFGCDELYEKGYISIKDRVVIANNKQPATEETDSYIKSVVGNKVTLWNENNKKYFLWQLELNK